METKPVSSPEDVRKEIISLYSYLFDPSNRPPFHSEHLFTDEFIENCLVGVPKRESREEMIEQCLYGLKKKNGKMWAALLSWILPYLQNGNFITYFQFIDISPFKGCIVIPFKGNPDGGAWSPDGRRWLYDFSYFAYRLEKAIESRARGVVYFEDGVVALPIEFKDEHVAPVNIIGSG